jgi:hypothetical protein
VLHRYRAIENVVPTNHYRTNSAWQQLAIRADKPASQLSAALDLRNTQAAPPRKRWN